MGKLVSKSSNKGVWPGAFEAAGIIMARNAKLLSLLTMQHPFDPRFQGTRDIRGCFAQADLRGDTEDSSEEQPPEKCAIERAQYHSLSPFPT